MKLQHWKSKGLETPGSTRPNGRNAGYALLEMLVYIVVFAAAVNLMVSLLSTGSQLAATTSLSLGRMEGLRDVQDAFTKYTRSAASVVERAGDYVTLDDRLVLRMPEGIEADWDYVVLGRLHSPDQFGVLALREGEGGLENVYLKTLRQPLQRQHFAVDRSGARPAVTLELQIKLEEGERERPFLVHRNTAVPRGIRP